MVRLVHRLGKRTVKKEGEASFLLTDKTGSYLSFGSKENLTHMQGWFQIDDHMNLYKSINNIFLNSNLQEVENLFSHTVRKYEEGEESFFLTSTALIYEVRNYQGEINIQLDFRGIYDYDDSNRIYYIWKEEDNLIIQYPKHNKWLVIKGVKNYDVINNWIRKDYPFDKVRNSINSFYIYDALRINCNKKIKLFMSFAKSKEEAMRNTKIVSKNESLLKGLVNRQVKKICTEEKLSVNAALNSLDNLRTLLGKGNHHFEGIFAGLPWFFQIWSRDELISLNAFIKHSRFGFVKKKLFHYLNAINEQGRLPNRMPDSQLASADSIGWLFKRIYDFMIELEKKNLLEKALKKDELLFIKHKLHFFIEETMAQYMRHNVIFNSTNETWMDSGKNPWEGRAGACIEIQCLFIAGFKLMQLLCQKLNLPYKGYGGMEALFRNEIRKNFLKKGKLLDRVGDETARPNIFIAYYVYPELLSKTEWKLAFDKVLTKLWLDWGGFSSIDKTIGAFQPEYTGENNQSYHKGDSWFWINNLAAICLADLDREKYEYYIECIYCASEKELLFSGFIGHSAEVSSAKELRSEGCWAQAWSAALFIELYHKINSIT